MWKNRIFFLNLKWQKYLNILIFDIQQRFEWSVWWLLSAGPHNNISVMTNMLLWPRKYALLLITAVYWKQTVEKQIVLAVILLALFWKPSDFRYRWTENNNADNKYVNIFIWRTFLYIQYSLTVSIMGLEINYGFTHVLFTIITVVNKCKEINEHRYVRTKQFAWFHKTTNHNIRSTCVKKRVKALLINPPELHLSKPWH